MSEPCPYCGSPSEVIDLGGGHVCIGCPECGLGGPTARNYDVQLAKKAWSHLCGSICTHCRKNLIKHYNNRIKELKAEIARLKGEEYGCDSQRTETCAR